MRRKTLDELVVRVALETKKYLDNKELPKDERAATYALLKATLHYSRSVQYKDEFIKLMIDQYEDDRARSTRYKED